MLKKFFSKKKEEPKKGSQKTKIVIKRRIPIEEQSASVFRPSPIVPEQEETPANERVEEQTLNSTIAEEQESIEPTINLEDEAEAAAEKEEEEIFAGIIADKEEETIELKSQMDSLREENKRLETELEKLKNLPKDSNEFLSASEAKVSVLQDKNLLLSKELSNLLESKMSISKELKLLKEEKENLSISLKAFETVREERENALGDAKDNIINLEEKKATLEIERENLQSKLEIALQNNEILQTENTDLLENLEKQKVAYEERTLELEEIEVKTKREIEELQIDVESMRISLEDAGGDKLETKEELDLSLREVTQLQSEIHELVSLKRELEKQVKEANLTASQHEEELAKLQTIISEKDGQIGEGDEEIQRLINEVNVLSNDKLQLGVSSRKIDKSNRKLERSLELLQKEKEDLLDALQALEKGSESSKSALDFSQSEISQLKEDKEDLLAAQDKLEETKVELNNKLNEIEDANLELARVVEKQASELKRAQYEKEELTASLTEVEKSKKALLTIQEELEETKDTIERKLESITEEKNSLLQSLERLEAGSEDNNSTLDAFKQEVAELEKEKSEILILNKDLEKQLLSFSKERESEKATFVEKINGLEKNVLAFQDMLSSTEARTEELESEKEQLLMALESGESSSSKVYEDEIVGLKKEKDRLLRDQKEMETRTTELEEELFVQKEMKQKMMQKIEILESSSLESDSVKDKEIKRLKVQIEGQMSSLSSEKSALSGELQLFKTKISNQNKIIADLKEQVQELENNKKSSQTEPVFVEEKAQETEGEDVFYNIVILLMPENEEFELELPIGLSGAEIIGELVEAEVLDPQANYRLTLKRTGHIIPDSKTLIDCEVEEGDLVVIARI